MTEIDRKKYVLAIDLGSSGLKAALVSEMGEVKSRFFEPYGFIFLPDGAVEQDAALWWKLSMKAMKQLIAESGIPSEQIVAICCDSQYSLIIPVNEHAEPLMNAISWMDTRGGIYNRQLMKGFPAVNRKSLRKQLKFVRLTGLTPTASGIDSLGHMLAVKNILPEIYKKTYKFLEPMDYLTSRLTGKISASQHTVTMMMLTSNRRWGEEAYCRPLVEWSGLDPDKLPELLPSDGIVGNITFSIAEELGLSPETRVICGMYDNQAAIAGAGIIDFQQGLQLVSTTLSFNGLVDSKKTDLANGITSIPSCLPDKYMLLCEQGLGGKCFDFHLNNIVCHDDALSFGEVPENAFELLNDLAAQVPPGSDKVMFLPWLNGAGAPLSSSRARGGFFNLSLKSNRCHLTRAVMEGVAFNSRAALGLVEKFMGTKFKELRFAGGGALSDIWAQAYADILQVTIHQIDDPVQVTCRGAALLGLVRLGYISLDDIPKRVKIKKSFEPNESHFPIYNQLFAQFKAIFKNNKATFKALNG